MSGRGPWPLQPEGPPPKSRRLSRRFSTASPPRPPGLPPQPLPAHRGSAPQGAGLESTGCPGSLRAFSRSAWSFPCHVPDSSRVARARFVPGVCRRPAALSEETWPRPWPAACPGAALEGPSALITAASGLPVGRGSGVFPATPPGQHGCRAPSFGSSPSWPGDRASGRSCVVTLTFGACRAAGFRASPRAMLSRASPW